MSVSVSRRALISVLLFAAAFAATAFQYPTVRMGEGYETLSVARNLAEHGQFANPFSPRLTGPTAHVAPIYPAFLALLIKAFGNSVVFVLVVNGITMAIHGLHAALLPSVSELFFQDRGPGIWAAVVTIVLPAFFLFPQYEIMYVATGLMLFCLASSRFALRDGIGSALTVGAAIGFLALLNPASVLVSVLWLAYVLAGRQTGRTARFLCLAVLAAAATIAPWTWRNYRQFHRPIVIRDNLGLELYISNNDFAEGSFALNEANGTHRRLHPNNSDIASKACLTLGEAEYYQRCGASAIEWIRSHPARFADLTATRIRMFWFPNADGSPGYARSIALITTAAFLGMLLLYWRRCRVVGFVAGALLAYPFLYYFVQSDPRYRTPILWIPLLAAGYFLAELAAKVKRAVERRTQRP